MEKTNKNQKSKQSGITLIALVITIIVLLILAAISIATLTGENGILTKAEGAQEKAKRQEIIENAKLDILEYETENEGKISDNKAKEIIAKYAKDYTEGYIFKTNENEEEYFLTEEGYNILVSEIWKTRKIITFSVQMRYWDIFDHCYAPYMEDKVYQGYEGMTWKEWLQSEFNKDGWYVYNGEKDAYRGHIIFKVTPYEHHTDNVGYFELTKVEDSVIVNLVTGDELIGEGYALVCT